MPTLSAAPPRTCYPQQISEQVAFDIARNSQGSFQPIFGRFDVEDLQALLVELNRARLSGGLGEGAPPLLHLYFGDTRGTADAKVPSEILLSVQDLEQEEAAGQALMAPKGAVMHVVYDRVHDASEPVSDEMARRIYKSHSPQLRHHHVDPMGLQALLLQASKRGSTVHAYFGRNPHRAAAGLDPDPDTIVLASRPPIDATNTGLDEGEVEFLEHTNDWP